MRVCPWAALAAGTLLLAAGVVLLINGLSRDQLLAHVAAPVVKTSAPVTATPTATADTTSAAVSNAAPASTDPELVIKSVGLKAPLLPLKVTGGRVEPPSFADAFWLETTGFAGVHQSTAPTIVAFHASTDARAGALGDLIWDRVAQRAKVQPGDELIADGVEFKVTRTFTQPKLGADRRDPAWTNPGDLLIVTCAEAADAATTARHADSNLLVVAERVS